jgi:hypothetical protein
MLITHLNLERMLRTSENIPSLPQGVVLTQAQELINLLLYHDGVNEQPQAPVALLLRKEVLC